MRCIGFEEDFLEFFETSTPQDEYQMTKKASLIIRLIFFLNKFRIYR